MNRVFLLSDHGGYYLKKRIEIALCTVNNLTYQILDIGCHADTVVDYPDIVNFLKSHFTKNDLAILICKSGVGMNICANKIKGIRSAVCRDLNDARLAREHNDVNAICLGQSFEYSQKNLFDILECFLFTKCTEERHKKRIAKIEKYFD